MELTLSVVIDGTTYEVRTRPSHVLQWERRAKCLASNIPSRGLGIEDLLYFAWLGLRDNPDIEVSKTLEAFADTVDSIDLVGDTARPTNAGLSAD